MKIRLLVLSLVMVFIFPAFAKGEDIRSLAIQPEAMVFSDFSSPELVAVPQKQFAKSLKYYAGSFKRKWGTLVLQTLSRLNMLLAADGKGLLLDRSQNMVLKGSKKRIQITWIKSPNKDLVLEIRKDKSASLGYQIQL